MVTHEEYQQLVEAAKTAIQDGDIERAIDQYEQAYDLAQTISINQQLAQLYFNQGQYEAALRLIREFTQTYLTLDDAAQTFYVSCCLAGGAFIEARQVIYQNPHLKSQLEQVEQAEAAYRKEQVTALKENQKAFYHLSDNPMGMQSQVIQTAKKLPLTEFLFSAKSILVDPFAHQLSRVSVLEELIKLGTTNPVEMFNLLGEKECLVPAELVDFEQQPLVIEVMQRLEASPLVNDPSQFVILKQQFTLCLMLLMPDFEQAMGDVQTWMEQTLLMFGFEFVTDRSESERQQEWRQHLSTALMAL